MKKLELVGSGDFSSGADDKGVEKKGHFWAYGQEQGGFLINKELMKTLGWSKDVKPSFPFYAIIEEKDRIIVQGDEEVATKIVQATSIFKSEDEMLRAYTSSARFITKANAMVEGEALDAKLALRAKATTAGLNEAAVNALLSAAV